MKYSILVRMLTFGMMMSVLVGCASSQVSPPSAITDENKEPARIAIEELDNTARAEREVPTTTVDPTTHEEALTRLRTLTPGGQ